MARTGCISTRWCFSFMLGLGLGFIWIILVLAHWNRSQLVMLLHSDIISWFRSDHYILYSLINRSAEYILCLQTISEIHLVRNIWGSLILFILYCWFYTRIWLSTTTCTMAALLRIRNTYNSRWHLDHGFKLLLGRTNNY
jgi:hypothetical protein